MKKQSDEINIAVMAGSIKNIEDKVNSIDNRLRSDFVTNDKLQLTVDKVSRLEKLVYGVCGLVGLAVVGAIINLIIRK